MLPCRRRLAAASSSKRTRFGSNPTSSASISISEALSANGMRESHVRGSHGSKASALPSDNSSFNRAAMPKDTKINLGPEDKFTAPPPRGARS